MEVAFAVLPVVLAFVAERYVSPRAWPWVVTCCVLVTLMALVISQPIQGPLLAMPKAGAAALVLIAGGIILGGTYYCARTWEENKATQTRAEKVNRLALAAAYQVDVVPDSVPFPHFQVLELGPSSAGVYGMNRPIPGGVWLECVIQNVGDARLEDILLTYRVEQGGRPKGDTHFPIQGLSVNEKYTFYIVNTDRVRQRVVFPEQATARIYNESERVEIQLRRAQESGLYDPSHDLAGGHWK
jgi:hypothetical protein